MRRVGRAWTAARAWLVPAAVLVLAVVLLQLSGGLATVAGAQGREAAAGEELTLARWVLVVHSAELVDGNEYEPESEPPRLRVHLRATFEGERTAYGLGTSLVTVRGPAGTPPPEDSPLTDGERDGNLDPGVAQELVLDFRWPDAPAQAPDTVRVLIRDEEEKESYLSAPAWGARAAPSLHVDLPCPDRRTPR